MTGNIFTSLLREYTFTDSGTLPNADILMFANAEKDDLAEFIADQMGEDIFMLTYKRNLEAGKREYSLPRQTLLNIKRVTAALDGEKNVLIEEFDINDIRKPLVTEDDITSAFAGRKPRFDMLDIGIKIYSEVPIIDVTEGLNIEIIQYPENIIEANLSSDSDLSTASATTKTRLPKAAHRVWLLKTSIAYKESRPKPIPLNKTEENIEFYIERMITNLRGRNLDRSYTPDIPVDNGFNY